jgi:hypothetical protein
VTQEVHADDVPVSRPEIHLRAMPMPPIRPANVSITNANSERACAFVDSRGGLLSSCNFFLVTFFLVEYPGEKEREKER